MLPLFGDPQPEGKRDVMEGRLLRLGLDALKLGTNVVLDFGCWSRDERSAIRWLVMSVGASCHLMYVPVDHETQRARIAHRQSTTPDQTFVMSETDLLRWRTLFEQPDATELDGHEVGGPPPGWSGWPEWAADRWPSLARLPGQPWCRPATQPCQECRARNDPPDSTPSAVTGKVHRCWS